MNNLEMEVITIHKNEAENFVNSITFDDRSQEELIIRVDVKTPDEWTQLFHSIYQLTGYKFLVQYTKDDGTRFVWRQVYRCGHRVGYDR